MQIFLLLVLVLTGRSLPADFIRSDANRDGRINITDAFTQVLATFDPELHLTCEDAADSNDDGQIDVADAMTTLGFIFLAGPEIAYPGPFASGPDPTCDPLGCSDAETSTPAVVLSEIMYKPLVGFNQPPAEFIEIYNRASIDIDIGGYRFTDGVRFTFPERTVIPAGDFLLVVRDVNSPPWKREPAATRVVGAFVGSLADGGERVTLRNGDCLVETVRYDDRSPWPIGPDGYAPSLERIDYLAPADDFHSWRTSFSAPISIGRGGTPGVANTTLGTPTHPTIIESTFEPEHPGAADPVKVTIRLDVPATEIQRITLRWEGVVEDVLTEVQKIDMEFGFDEAGSGTFFATLPPGPSQSIVRYNLEVEHDGAHGGQGTFLPHPADKAPVLSYFVYDGEIEAKLPILWLFPSKRSGLVPEELDRKLDLSAAAIKEVDGAFPVLFDGAELHSKLSALDIQGHDVKFLKGAEYRLFPSGDRSINILFEDNGQSSHREHLALEVFRDLGALAQWGRWYRVLDFTPLAPADGRHSQRLVFQQVNERFFGMNGLGTNGDLYKVNKLGFGKRTNLETGRQALDELFHALNTDGPEGRRNAVFERLDLDNIRLYSAVSVLIVNWDGFHNNNFLYNELTPGSTWKIVPWDLDSVFGCAVFPLTYPFDGLSRCTERLPNPIIRPYHEQLDLVELYRETIKTFIAPGGPFSEATLGARIDAIETLLLEDLKLQEAFLGTERTKRREQILGAYTSLRGFAGPRISFLRDELGLP